MSTEIVSFDGTERCCARLAEPDRYASLLRSFSGSGSSAVQGAGLSYCLASAVDGGTIVSMRHFDRVLDFDAERRLVTVESGLTVGALHDFAVAHDCYFPVLPGHPSITVGGCVGFNVHGKTQHNVGHFSDHVVALTLFHPDHGEIRCHAAEDRDLLDLTLGGMGLTGCVLDVTLQLMPLKAGAVRRRAHQVANLGDAVCLMRELDADALYSWNDFNRGGGHFGAGVVYEERFEAGDVAATSRYRRLRARPRRSPPLWNPVTVRAVNWAYRSRDRMRPDRLQSVHDVAFPINGSEPYFTGFGARGFHECQMVLSHDAFPSAAVELERTLSRSAVPVTLGSLKLFAGTPRLLWFVDDGVCVTVDVPAVPEARPLFERLDDLAVDHGARVNIAKDSRLSATTVAKLFPEYDAFRSRLERFDPARRFDTALRRRLDL